MIVGDANTTQADDVDSACLLYVPDITAADTIGQYPALAQLVTNDEEPFWLDILDPEIDPEWYQKLGWTMRSLNAGDRFWILGEGQAARAGDQHRDNEIVVHEKT